MEHPHGGLLCSTEYNLAFVGKKQKYARLRNDLIGWAICKKYKVCAMLPARCPKFTKFTDLVQKLIGQEPLVSVHPEAHLRSKQGSVKLSDNRWAPLLAMCALN
jgi:hypothetical protein